MRKDNCERDEMTDLFGQSPSSISKSPLGSNSELVHFVCLLKRLAIVLLLYTACRIAFYTLNWGFFQGLSGAELRSAFLGGVRFDVAAIVYTNLLVIFLHIIPLAARSSAGYQRILKWVFYFSNVPFLLTNCGDIAYFRFTAKRSASDVFTLVSTGDDFIRLLPRYLLDFWYTIAICVALVGIAEMLYRRTGPAKPMGAPGTRSRAAPALTVMATIGLSVLGARGGLQLKPISIITAGLYVPPQFAPLVLNTPFTLLRTLGKQQLAPAEYLNPTEHEALHSTHHPAFTGGFRPLNVVVILLESFSKEFIGQGANGESYTPFLDSLIDRGLLFDRAYANGKNSVEGIPAVIAGIPSLMRTPYEFSPYGSGRVTSLASTLARKGYDTAFFHGGTNGTMMFDVFAQIAGYKRYYGRADYNNEADYDGHWGIWDEEFFQYFAKHLEHMPQPFQATLFTLTSHHPYPVPEKYRARFKGGPLQILPSIQYTDFSLQRFFESASKMPWYDNTLFVLSADHTAEPEQPGERNQVRMYEIPILFFRPNGELRGRVTAPLQQIDVLPTVLDILNYDQPFFAFGSSGIDPKAKRYAVNFLNDFYEIIRDPYVLSFDGSRSVALHDFSHDPELRTNLIQKQLPVGAELELQLKAFIQSFNSALINNAMVVNN